MTPPSESAIARVLVEQGRYGVQAAAQRGFRWARAARKLAERDGRYGPEWEAWATLEVRLARIAAPALEFL